MIWTLSFELPLIQRVAEAIIADISGPKGLQLGSDYVALAPSLFSGGGFSVSAVVAPMTDLTVITRGAGPSGVSLAIGTTRAPRTPTSGAAITVGGVLCQELVHQKQRAQDPISFQMAAAVQKEWHTSRPPQPSPEEWLSGYLGAVHEFEAHAEQIAFELWMMDTVAGAAPRKSVTLAGVTHSEPMRRIRMRLTPAGSASPTVALWCVLLEQKVNEALTKW